MIISESSPLPSSPCSYTLLEEISGRGRRSGGSGRGVGGGGGEGVRGKDCPPYSCICSPRVTHHESTTRIRRAIT